MDPNTQQPGQEPAQQNTPAGAPQPVQAPHAQNGQGGHPGQ